MGLKCSKCDFVNHDGMKYCGNCGAKLNVDLQDLGERKIATVLFADLTGFTKLSTTMDPEELNELLNKIISHMIGIIEYFGGTIDKIIGDEIMAIFGVPKSLENHMERALLCSIEMHNAMKSFKDKKGNNLFLHIGIGSGEIVVSHIGSNEIRDKTVLGDMVNIASRLENIAKAGQTAINESIKSRLENIYDFEPIGKRKLKGVKTPMPIYLLKGTKKYRGRIRGVHGFSAPFVGRNTEIKQTLELYGKFKRTGKEKLLTIIGEPGVGKSRLFEEIINKISFDDIYIYKSRYIAYIQESYFAFKNIIREIFDIKLEESENEILLKLKSNKILRHIKVPDKELLILDFLGIREYSKIKPDEKINQQYFLFEQIFITLSKQKPLIIVFEDIHWIDINSIELLKYLFTFLKKYPVLFILISRPLIKRYDVLELFNKYKHKTIKLKPLIPKESKKLLKLLLSTMVLPNNFTEKLLDKCGGNPLYIEEIIEILLDKNVIVKENDKYILFKSIDDIKIPESIEELIQARIDLLHKDDKTILQYASIIGKDFWDKPISIFLNKIITENLNKLSYSEFINKQETSILLNTKEFSFKHILIQEAIYRNVLKKIRREIHVKFADWLETNYIEQKEQLSSILSYHYENGKKWDKAANYYYIKGKWEISNYSNESAIKSLKQATRIINDNIINKPDYSWKIHNNLGKIYTRIGENGKAIKSFEKALEYNISNIDKSKIYHNYADVLFNTSEYDEALNFISKAKSIIPLKSIEMLDILYSEIYLYQFKGDIDTALDLLNKRYEITHNLSDSISYIKKKEMEGSNYSIMGNIAEHKRKYREALVNFEKAIEIFKEINDIASLSVVYNNVAQIYLSLGWISKTIDSYEKSIKIDLLRGNKLGEATGYFNIGDTYIFLNALSKAKRYIKKYTDLNALINNISGDAYANMGMGDIYLIEKKYDKALEHYIRSANIFNKIGANYLYLFTIISQAKVHIKTKNYRKVKNIIEEISNDTKKYPDLQFEIKNLNIEMSANKGKYKQAIKQYIDQCNILEKEQFFDELLFLYSKITELSKNRIDTTYTDYLNKGKMLLERLLAGINDDKLEKQFIKREELRCFLNE